MNVFKPARFDIYNILCIAGINCIRYGKHGSPTLGESLFAVTSKGEVCAFDSSLMDNIDPPEEECIAKQKGESSFKQEIPVAGITTPFIHPLENSFTPGSALFVTAKINEDADRLAFGAEFREI